MISRYCFVSFWSNGKRNFPRIFLGCFVVFIFFIVIFCVCFILIELYFICDTVTRQLDMCDTALYLLIRSHLYLHILHRFTPNLAHSWQTGAHPIYVTRAKHPVPFVFTRIRNTTRVLCRLTLTATVQMGPHSRPKRFRIPEHKAFVIRPLLFQNYIPHT